MVDLSIPYGLDTNGLMVSARHVPNGIGCGCVCPGCKRSLIAHQGEVKAWHFQHEADVDGAAFLCATGYETSIHLKAKHIIMAHTRIVTPTLWATFHNEERIGIAAGWRDYTAIGEEVTLTDIRRRPDVMVKMEPGPLAIEVFYSHRCSPEKIEAFKSRDLAAIEIDLSGYNREIVEDEIALSEAVLRSARRFWLFHPAKARLDAEFRAEVMEQRRIAAAREAERLAAIEAARLAAMEESRRRAEEESARLAELERIRREGEAIRAKAEAERLAAIAEAQRARAEELVRLRAESERLRAEAWESGKALREEKEAEAAAKLAAEYEEARRWRAWNDAILVEQKAQARRERGRYEIAAARSGVRVWEEYWRNIPDGAGTLQRARDLLAAAERSYPES